MNRPQLRCCWRREKRYADVFNRVEHGDERALHWLRYLMALGFEEAVLLETAADLRFAPEFVARHIAEWQRQNPLDLIITGCQSSEGQNGQTPFCWRKCWSGPASPRWSALLDAPFITLEQRTEHGVRCCRVRLPAVIAVRQCGEVALPVPGMRQRMAAGKAAIIRKTVAVELPAMQCLQLARAEQRRGATLIGGQTVAEKRKSYGRTIYAKGCSHEYRNCDNKSGPCRNSELAGGAGFQRLYPGTLANRTTADGCGTGAGCTGGTVATNACGRCPFPPGAFGDELSTRLAWRLHGASICQVTSLDIPTVSVRKSHWGNALTATLQTDKRPLCLSLARQAGADKNATLPSGMQQLNIVPGVLPDWLVSIENLKMLSATH